ncbi:hypothetical protein JCM14108_1139 [Lentilactobacillus farraginis DSM 18382 = JCM 14108]|uniref:Uncharacterized protein n=1 Tax=Lentilactobacillus farraginis DSM 18382 = JCM 14108 TaxID=1423743 RepID=X0PA18_9LACO|nr:hypothetical protein JCM14108_1139 [Lentilactobacillus farraginis DSM 18382 = JCM 14108]
MSLIEINNLKVHYPFGAVFGIGLSTTLRRLTALHLILKPAKPMGWLANRVPVNQPRPKR